ncbi:uncharacterized protein LOC130743985 [Lotus japonicus]|uniref:uncharacterized protein LOC130743985 n=1 Tax=Lotus japonicus TaxID=34305 RepID=UPI00258B5D74|nr:uncharacterized protein LOC130743985 [Lotus japonicus]
MDKEIKLQGDSSEVTHGHGCGVFVKGETMYLIFDDLKVVQSSPGNYVQQLLQLGYKNILNLVELSPSVGLHEILGLLKQALTSKSPLSDVFLANGESKQISTFSPKLGPSARSKHCINNCIINLKITVIKSKKKILYAEAEDDFVDFLFSFLTTPLGSFPMGCMDNLSKSVKDLNPSWFATPSGTDLLLDPRVASQFGCWRQPLKLSEDGTLYWYSTNVLSKKRDPMLNPVAMKLFEPRSPDGTRTYTEGFVRRPSLFVVWDDLQVASLADTSSISILQDLNVPLDDLEEHVVSIGEKVVTPFFTNFIL